MPKIGGKRVFFSALNQIRKNPGLIKRMKLLMKLQLGIKFLRVGLITFLNLAFIIRRGDIPFPMKLVIKDMREVMYPNTAMKLRV